MIDFKVQGMTCGGCARGVTNALQRVDANAVVNVDLARKTVSVSPMLPEGFAGRARKRIVR